MKGKAAWLGMAVMMAVIGIALAGCATGPSSSPAAGNSQTDLLKAAGFRTHTAQGGNVAYLYTLPAKKVVLNKYQDKPVYLVCTDPDSKQCYLGDQAAYERYQQLAIQQSISDDQHKVMQERFDPEAQQMWVNSQGGG
jgi:ABC-type Fe3+-hydroxamate transport system substrate-binding protein